MAKGFSKNKFVGAIKTMKIRNPDTSLEFNFRLKEYKGFIVVENHQIIGITNSKKGGNTENELTVLWDIYEAALPNLLNFYNASFDESVFTFSADFSNFFSAQKAKLHFYPSWWDFTDPQYRKRRSLELKASGLDSLSNSTSARDDNKVGSSKTPHDRAGHWRQCKSGKNVWVRSCKVNQHK